MPDLMNLVLLPDGKQVATQPIDRNAYSGYRLVLEGAFRFAYTGETIDAVNRFRPNGEVLGEHSFLAWRPRAPRLMSQDVTSHRYVFQIPEDWDMNGQSLSVGLDTDAFIRTYNITSSEALGDLTGEIRATFQAEPIVVGPPLWMLPGLPLAGLLAGTAWVVRRRASYGGLEEDLRGQIGELSLKAKSALALAAKQKRTSKELRSRITALQNGSVEVAQRLQTIRRRLATIDTRRTTDEITALEVRLAGTAETTTRYEAEAALDQKRKALRAAEELQAAEERCRLRLSKIEGVIDSVCLQLERANVGEAVGPVEDTVLRELDSEVRAVGEVAREEEQQAYLRVR